MWNVIVGVKLRPYPFMGRSAKKAGSQTAATIHLVSSKIGFFHHLSTKGMFGCSNVESHSHTSVVRFLGVKGN